MDDRTFLKEICSNNDDESDEYQDFLYHVAASAINETNNILSEARRVIEVTINNKKEIENFKGGKEKVDSK